MKPEEITAACADIQATGEELQGLRAAEYDPSVGLFEVSDERMAEAVEDWRDATGPEVVLTLLAVHEDALAEIDRLRRQQQTALDEVRKLESKWEAEYELAPPYCDEHAGGKAEAYTGAVETLQDAFGLEDYGDVIPKEDPDAS